MSQHERTGWRDADLSQRHRRWGSDCPAVDIDALFLEYNHALPVALVEYKHNRAEHIDLNAPNVGAQEELCNRAGLPFFIAVYWPGEWSFLVQPGNEHARHHIGGRRYMSERAYVELMYRIRGNPLRQHVSAKLSDVLIPKDAAIQPRIIERKSGDGVIIPFRGVL